MPGEIETMLTEIGTRLASRGIDAGLGALAETRIGSTPTGRAALGAVDALVDEYGDDAVSAILRLVHARLERRADRIVDEAQRRNDEEAERARRRLARTLPGDGQQ